MPATTTLHAKHDLAHLERRLTELQHSLSDLSGDQDLSEMFKIIHFPGWTTPAEFILVAGLVENMLRQAQALAAAKNTLLTGSRQVGVEG